MIREAEPQARQSKRARIAKVLKGMKPYNAAELKKAFKNKHIKALNYPNA